MKKEEEALRIVEIDIDDIVKPFEYQARKSFDDGLISRIAESIKKDGFLQNIIVVEEPNGKYQIVAGETRYRAAKRAGLKKIPALIHSSDVNKKDLIKMSLFENVSRANLSNFELYVFFQKIMKEEGIKTYSQLSEYFDGIIPVHQIKKVMSFNSLHSEIVTNEMNGKSINLEILISIKANAKKISMKKNISLADAYDEYILPVYRKILNKSLTVRESKKILNSLLNGAQEDIVKVERDKVYIKNSKLESFSKEKKQMLIDIINNFIQENS